METWLKFSDHQQTRREPSSFRPNTTAQSTARWRQTGCAVSSSPGQGIRMPPKLAANGRAAGNGASGRPPQPTAQVGAARSRQPGSSGPPSARTSPQEPMGQGATVGPRTATCKKPSTTLRLPAKPEPRAASPSARSQRSVRSSRPCEIPSARLPAPKAATPAAAASATKPPPPPPGAKLTANARSTSKRLLACNGDPRAEFQVKKDSALLIQKQFRAKTLRKRLQTIRRRAAESGISEFKGVLNEDGMPIGIAGTSGKWYVGTSIGCLSPWNPLRVRIITIVDDRRFNLAMLLCVIMNSFL